MIYLSVLDVLGFHQALIEHFGGADGLRDKGLFEAAVHRPQSGYYPDLLSQAAALW